MNGIVPLPPEQHKEIMDAVNASQGMTPEEWDALFPDEPRTVAQKYPVREQANGTKWYRSAAVAREGREGGEKLSFNQLGWTSNPGWADPSYGVGDGNGTAF